MVWARWLSLTAVPLVFPELTVTDDCYLKPPRLPAWYLAEGPNSSYDIEEAYPPAGSSLRGYWEIS